MRGLTILVVTADPARYHAALSLAAAQAALGGRARVHLHEEAVALLIDAGSTELRAECTALGVSFSACQAGSSALHDARLPADIDADGPVGLLSRLGDDRLLVV